jgi:hypothetical protein
MKLTALILTSLLLATTAIGCGGAPDEIGDTSDEIRNGGFGNQRPKWCSDTGSCRCSKLIENDCEDMSAVCTDASVDALIACINGHWVTDCFCRMQGLTIRPGSPAIPPGGGVVGGG